MKPIREYWDEMYGQRVLVKVYPPAGEGKFVKFAKVRPSWAVDDTAYSSKMTAEQSDRRRINPFDIATDEEAFDA